LVYGAVYFAHSAAPIFGVVLTFPFILYVGRYFNDIELTVFWHPPLWSSKKSKIVEGKV